MTLGLLTGQAFCRNDDCHVLCWDPASTLQEFMDSAVYINGPELGLGDPRRS